MFFLINLLQAATPVLYEGDDPGECTDRADNDRNALFDCMDAGCKGAPDCVPFVTVDGNNTLIVGEKSLARGTFYVGYMVPVEQPPLSWVSSDPSVVAVSKEGEMTALAVGKATVTVANGPFHSFMEITVVSKEDAGNIQPKPVMGLIPPSDGESFGALGEGWGDASGWGDMGSGPSISMDPIILGALDLSQISVVIKRNMNAIQYCYQKELTKNPSLQGRVAVKFVITKDGSVSSATTKATTLNNPAVESCINSRFMQFQFPEPKGGGIVIVTYPFEFKAG